MASVENIPKYVRYDFFMALFGILVAYFLFTNERVYDNPDLRAFLVTLSTVTIFYGILEMKNNYNKEKEVQDIKREIEKLNAEKELEKIRKLKASAHNS